MGDPTAEGEGRFARLSAALLVGGRSTRMGVDKARLEIDGRSLCARIAERVAPLVSDLLLVGGDPPEDAPGRRAPDPPGPACALRGLVGALEHARGERVLVLATDLAGLRTELLLALLAAPAADAVAPRRDGRWHPLCALYRREPALARAREHLAAGRLALHALLDALDARALEGAALDALDPDGLQLANVNTPEDWEALRARLARS